jgi:hypothetical protein
MYKQTIFNVTCIDKKRQQYTVLLQKDEKFKVTLELIDILDVIGLDWIGLMRTNKNETKYVCYLANLKDLKDTLCIVK